ncbi:transposase [Oculatella sp. LEGE 06141]
MSKVYPSDLSRSQYEFLNDILPPAKSGGRPRSVAMWAVLRAC